MSYDTFGIVPARACRRSNDAHAGHDGWKVNYDSLPMGAQIAIDDRLFTWPSDSPALIGSRCSCGTVAFPSQDTCPRCGGDMDVIALPTRGTLWTYTTQGFRPKGPPEGYYLGPESEAEFVPYALGYVELPGHCKVETRLVGDDFDFDAEMELVIVPFRRDEEGNELMTFAFKRAGA
jgi:uncharacterized OB-fold protein